MKTVKSTIRYALILALAFSVTYILGSAAKSADISEEAGLSTLAGASDYCRALSAVCVFDDAGDACDATTYSDWVLGTRENLTTFIGIVTDTSPVWTKDQGVVDGRYYTIQLDSGRWTQIDPEQTRNVRCTR